MKKEEGRMKNLIHTPGADLFQPSAFSLIYSVAKAVTVGEVLCLI